MKKASSLLSLQIVAPTVFGQYTTFKNLFQMVLGSTTLNKLVQVIDLVILTSMFVAAVINYRRSIQTANKTKRLHNEEKEAYDVAQQFYIDAI